jgi:hypothetical protein
MKSIAWNKKLHALTTAQIGTDNSTPARGIGAQHQNFNRIAKVIVIKLIVAIRCNRTCASGVTIK